MVYYTVCGRINNQIKIRGNRVELDEINSVLLNECNVKNAYSIFRNNSIYTFVCDDIELDLEKIKTILKDKLPVYMISSKIIQIESMPLKTSGKINEDELINLTNNNKVFDANEVAKLILDNKFTEYDEYTIEMLSIDSLETLKLLQIISEKIEYKKSEFYDELLKEIVTMKILEIRRFIEEWGKK